MPAIPQGRRFKGELAEARMCCSMEQELLPDYVGLVMSACLVFLPFPGTYLQAWCPGLTEDGTNTVASFP